MARLLTYRCKNWRACQGEVSISERVWARMQRLGLSLPERCDKCRIARARTRKKPKIPYFTAEIAANAPIFSYYRSLHTSHGDRERNFADLPKTAPPGRVRITDDLIRQLYELLDQNQVVVLASPTGTGKSTRVLYRLLEAFEGYEGETVSRLLSQGQVIQTQPLSAATELIPTRVATGELAEDRAGRFRALGLRHSKRREHDEFNLGVVVTDGSLRNWIRDGQIGNYNLLMIDEAHKRTVNIDELLVLLRHKLPAYPHLRVLIASATIALEDFERAFREAGVSVAVLDLGKFLGDAADYHQHFLDQGTLPGCDCAFCARGRSWASLRRSPQSERQLPDAVTETVLSILGASKEGSILAFLPGEAAIEATRRQLEEQLPAGRAVPVVPIYSRLGEIEVEKRFGLHVGGRRILLTTDIAETSHTLPDLVYVVESGFQKETCWDPATGTQSLETLRCSQARCRQRWGRVGRVGKGYVYCLYTDGEFNSFKPQTTPEVFRNQLEDVVLNAKAAGIGVVTPEDFVGGDQEEHQTLKAELARAEMSLRHGGFVADDGTITPAGLDLSYSSLGALDKALLDLAEEHNCLLEATTALALMRTESGEARTGARLTHPLGGLLVWDWAWSARTKTEVYRIHRALQVGCVDDLDFVAKIARLFSRAERRGIAADWARRHFVSETELRIALRRREELLEPYTIKVEEGPRVLDFNLLNRLRALMATVWVDRAVRIRKRNGKLEFKSEDATEETGRISEWCAGKWEDEERAILGAVTAFGRSSRGQGRQLVGSFLVKQPEAKARERLSYVFIDQVYPTGSWVEITKVEERDVLGTVLAPPEPIDVEYRTRVTVELLLDDALRAKWPATVGFPAEWLRNDPSDPLPLPAESIPLKAGAPHGRARILEWRTEAGVPMPELARSDELSSLAERKRSLRTGSEVQVEIRRILRDPWGFGAWAIGQMPDGLEVSVDASDLLIAYKHPAYELEALAGCKLPLRVDRLDTMGRPELSYLHAVVKSLRELRSRAEKEHSIRLEGRIADIQLERRRAIVVCHVSDSLIHYFPLELPDREIARLRVGEEVGVMLALPRSKEAFHSVELPQFAIAGLPKGISYERSRLTFPLALEETALRQCELPDDVVEAVIKISWSRAFFAQLAGVPVGWRGTATVVQHRTSRETGQLAGVAVEFEWNGSKMLGFVPRSRLHRLRGSPRIPEVGNQLQVEVEAVDPRGPILREVL